MTDHDVGLLRMKISVLEARVKSLEQDAYRYRWLRNGHGYFPEEIGARGGPELDEAIDREMETDKT